MKRLLIVDGMNVIHASASLRGQLERDPSIARARLVDWLASYAGSDWAVVVVFDGGAGGEGSVGETAGVTVIHTPAGRTADARIEALARDAREASRVAVVVTSDAATQWTAMGAGVTRMSARELLAELDEDARDRERDVARPRPGATIESRLSDEVRSGLFTLRDTQGAS